MTFLLRTFLLLLLLGRCTFSVVRGGAQHRGEQERVTFSVLTMQFTHLHTHNSGVDKYIRLWRQHSYLFFLEEGLNELRRVKGHLLGKLIETLLDPIFALDAFLSHLGLDTLQLLFLLSLKLLLLLGIFGFLRLRNLQLEFLLNFQIRLVFLFGVLLLKLLDLFILLLLELLEFLPRPVDDFLNLGIYHHLFHL